MLRTVEAALGLGTLTANDRYAPGLQPHIHNQQNPFSRTDRWLDNSRPPHLDPARPGQPRAPREHRPRRFLAAAAKTRQPVAWVANYASNSVSPVNLTTRTAGPPIPSRTRTAGDRRHPERRDRSTSRTACPTRSPRSRRAPARRAGAIRVGAAPWALAITPDGKTLYVADDGSATVTPIAIATNTARRADSGRSRPPRDRDGPGRRGPPTC